MILMKKCYIILGSALALAIITTAALFHYANRAHYVIHVVNTTNTQIEHVRVSGLDENGALGVLLPGAGKSVDMKGKTPSHAISLEFLRMDGNKASTGMILEPMTVIAGRLYELQIQSDQSVLVSDRDLSLRERLRW